MVASDSVRALPATWYTSPTLYELEKRAIFSKRWMLMTHRARFNQPGDWLKYEIMGCEIIICRDRHDKIQAFHNICRHRAFPIVHEQKGQALIFTCKYHGWSYGLDGKLSKAPGYQDIARFEKDKNGLLPIHVHIDVNGFIWINLDAREKPEISWNEDFLEVDTQARYKGYDFPGFRFDHTWKILGNFNWKLLGDNYNECYHCKTAHPDVPSVADLATYAVDTKGGQIQHFANPEDRKQIDAAMKIASTFCFPNASNTVSRDFMFIQRVVPLTPTTTCLQYEVFRHENANDVDFENIDAMFKRIMSEDKYLCNHVQKNINAGVFVNGEMHPRMEKGPIFFQQSIREQLKSHALQEEVANCEIWPAKQIIPDNATISHDDLDFCSRLACSPGDPALAW